MNFSESKQDILSLKGKTLVLSIEDVLFGYGGIAKYNNISILVYYKVVPGDLVKVKISEVKKNYCVAQVVEFLKVSDLRSTVKCPHNLKCGSCSWLDIDYHYQLLLKNKIIKNNILKIAGISPEVLDTIMSKEIYHYRNKVIFHIKRIAMPDQNTYSIGFYEYNTHNIIDIKSCFLFPKIFIDIKNELNDLLSKNKNFPFEINSVCIRTDTNNEIQCIYIINEDRGSIQYIKELFTDISNKLKSRFGEIKSFYLLKNKCSKDLLRGDIEYLVGEKKLSYKMNDIQTKKEFFFSLSPQSFFQVNTNQIQNIIQLIKNIIMSINYEGVHRSGNNVFFDLYSGVGIFSIMLSSFFDVVYGIENSNSSIEDFYENIRLNNIANVNVIKGDVYEEVKRLYSINITPTVVLVDPPRRGLKKELIELLCKKSIPKKIIYLSCDVSTLARDLKYFRENNFLPEYVIPVDMFPHTYHIESLSVLSYKNM